MKMCIYWDIHASCRFQCLYCLHDNVALHKQTEARYRSELSDVFHCYNSKYIHSMVPTLSNYHQLEYTDKSLLTAKT